MLPSSGERRVRRRHLGEISTPRVRCKSSPMLVWSHVKARSYRLRARRVSNSASRRLGRRCDAWVEVGGMAGEHGSGRKERGGQQQERALHGRFLGRVARCRSKRGGQRRRTSGGTSWRPEPGFTRRGPAGARHRCDRSSGRSSLCRRPALPAGNGRRVGPGRFCPPSNIVLRETAEGVLLCLLGGVRRQHPSCKWVGAGQHGLPPSQSGRGVGEDFADRPGRRRIQIGSGCRLHVLFEPAIECSLGGGELLERVGEVVAS